MIAAVRRYFARPIRRTGGWLVPRWMQDQHGERPLGRRDHDMAPECRGACRIDATRDPSISVTAERAREIVADMLSDDPLRQHAGFSAEQLALDSRVMAGSWPPRSAGFHMELV